MVTNFAVTFFTTMANTSISATRPTATAIPMFFAVSKVIAVMGER